ncbi:cytotoxic and regulatory T-cell molecule [Emydura macquarii macquarii]|uniref:cytotoxic and regulatory T-cell molecule n=1 Tax=Emydura macquarii macquarii TaxID=1129001 RepID=UPI00352B8C90
MTVTNVLYILALLPLQGDFQEVHTERVTVEEGQDLNLPCVVSGDNESALQWLDPRGFVIFLNTQRGLKDQRYKLIHYSKDELSISLSNVTVQDEGTYMCFYYDAQVRTKKVIVTVLAAPSKPVLEVSDIRTDGKEEKMVLSCLTQGGKPPPQITWLLDNGLEVYGDTKHKFEHDRKKCNSTSTLIVHAYKQDSTVSCVIRHETLRGEKLTVSFQFEHFVTTTGSTPNALEINTRTSKNPQHYLESTTATTESIIQTSSASISLETSTQQEVFSSETTAGSSQPNFPTIVPETPSSTSLPAIPTQPRELTASATIWPEVTPTPTVNEEFSSTEAPATSSEPATRNSNSTTGSERSLNITKKPSVTDAPTISSEQPTQISNITTGSEMTLNVTVAEETSGTEEPSPSHEETTLNSNATIKTDLNSEGIRQRKTSVLLPVLVAVLIFVMLIIVLLFMRKLKKAHGVWKRENDTSEQTLESYKSRSNEDNQALEKNGPFANQKLGLQYVTEGYAGAVRKNSEERDVSAFEKQLTFGKETDV